MFQCPSCNAQVQVSEEFAGKRIVCPHCAHSATVPASADATPQGITTPELAEAHVARKRRESTPDGDLSLISQTEVEQDYSARARSRLNITVTVGVLLAVVSIMVALLFAATVKIREGAARTQSINNLKQIGLAFHGFHDANKRLPFNGSDIVAEGQKYSRQAHAGNTNSGSWAWVILPYIDSNPVFNMAPERRPNVRVFAYLCPGRGRPDREEDRGAWTDYFYNNYLNDPKQAAKPDAADVRRALKDITDGSSNTIIVGHGNIDTRQYQAKADVTLSSNIFLGGTFGTARAGDNGEVAPGGVTLQRDSASAPTIGSWGGPFPQGALMCMGDATVRMFPYDTKNFSSFLTPTGKEEVMLPDS